MSSGCEKYWHCAAEYLKLAKEPNTMQVVADRYLRIAAYYSELADTEDTNEGEAKLIDATPRPAHESLAGKFWNFR